MFCEVRVHIRLFDNSIEFCEGFTHMKTLIFEHDIYNVIRLNIRKYRKERKMTAAVLSELVDVSHDFIRQIESEKVKTNFSVDTLYRIAVALDVSVDVLMGIQRNDEQQNDDENVST